MQPSDRCWLETSQMEEDEGLEAHSSSTVQAANTIVVYQVGGAGLCSISSSGQACARLCVAMSLPGADTGNMTHEYPKGLSFIPVNSVSIFLVPVSVPFGFWVDATVSSVKSELRSPLQLTAEKVQE